MNELLFYNSFTYDKEMAKETANHLYLKTKLMKLAYASLALGVIFFMILPLIKETFPELGELYSFIAPFILVCLIVSVCCFTVSYFSMIVQGSKKQADSMCIITVNENEIKWTKGEKTKTYNPKKIYAFYETENYIVAAAGLSTSEMIFKKNAFSVGSSEEFIKFLKKNGAYQIK